MSKESNNGSGRHRADGVLLVALACGETVETAATKAGVSPATVYRRLTDADFVAKLEAAKLDFVKRSTSMLGAAAVEAVKTLTDLQKDGVSPAVPFGAARATLELGGRLRTEGELVSRLEAAERLLDRLVKAEKPDAQSKKD